jgi:4-hydroxy-tetrahydrodipicolinate synthase
VPPQFRGICPPLLTPFTADEELDERALRAEVQYLLEIGVHGLVLTGSTGEGHTLSEEETVRVARVAVHEARGRVPVMSGIIRDSTRDAVRYGRALREAGVDALQVTPVHYLFHPGSAGNHAFYQEIGRSVGLPIVIYNVVTWNTIPVAEHLRFADIPQVIGVKQSGGDIHKLADLILAAQGRLQVLTAVDDLLMPSFLLGADGAVAAILTVLPDLCVALWDACQRGDLATARSLHERLLPVWRAVGGPDMPARAKTALGLRGRPVGPARHPLLPVTSAVRQEIAAALEQAGVLGPLAVG